MPQEHAEERPLHPDYGQWTVNSTQFDSVKYLGNYHGGPVFYHEDSATVFEADLDETAEEIIPDMDTARELLPDESLGEYIKEIEAEIGWDSLSPFGESQTESDTE
ncbi:MAG: hypothetical protein ABEI76_11505 [Halobacteriales archaeon]